MCAQVGFSQTKNIDTSIKMNAPIAKMTKGFFVEALYSINKSEGSINQQVINPTIILNQTVYMAGVGVGYRYLRLMDVGFETGVQVSQESGLMGSSQHAFYQVNGNLTYALNSHFYGFGGANLNYLNFYNGGQYKSVSSTPALGGQVGVGYTYNGFYGRVSYQYLQYNSKLEFARSNIDVFSVNNDFSLSGASAQLGYNF